MIDMSKIWKLVSPKEGVVGTSIFLVILALLIHAFVFFGSNRYIDRLLG